MCGIVGIVSADEVAPVLVKSIARLEYRGYDSCGVATLGPTGIEVRKDAGAVEEVAFREGLACAPGPAMPTTWKRRFRSSPTWSVAPWRFPPGSSFARRIVQETQRTILFGPETTHYLALFNQYALAALAEKFAPAMSADEAGHLVLSGPDSLLLAISQSGETFDTAICV